MNARKLFTILCGLGIGTTLAISSALPEALPAITSIKLNATSVDVDKPPAALPFSVNFTAPLGLQTILLWGDSRRLNAASQPQQAVMFYAATNIYPRSGTLSIETPFVYNAYMIDGSWEIIAAQICDVRSNCQYYDKTALVNIVLNPKFTVTNTTGMTDNTPVTVSTGKILTPEVNLTQSQVFRYRLAAAQGVQGVQHLLIYYMSAGSTATKFSETDFPAPIKSGTFIGGIYLPSDSPLGKYTIIGVEVCPIVFQDPCTGAHTPAAIRRLLGATTFTVTK